MQRLCAQFVTVGHYSDFVPILSEWVKYIGFVPILFDWVTHRLCSHSALSSFCLERAHADLVRVGHIHQPCLFVGSGWHTPTLFPPCKSGSHASLDFNPFTAKAFCKIVRSNVQRTVYANCQSPWCFFFSGVAKTWPLYVCTFRLWYSVNTNLQDAFSGVVKIWCWYISVGFNVHWSTLLSLTISLVWSNVENSDWSVWCGLTYVITKLSSLTTSFLPLLLCCCKPVDYTSWSPGFQKTSSGNIHTDIHYHNTMFCFVIFEKRFSTKSVRFARYMWKLTPKGLVSGL